MDTKRPHANPAEPRKPKNLDEVEQLREQIRANRPRTKDGVFWSEAVKTPSDYFDVAWHLPRLSLRFDFDSTEGEEFRDALKKVSDLYVDRYRGLGPTEGFHQYVNEIEKSLKARFSADEYRIDRTPEGIARWWMNFFDLYFDQSWYMPDQDIIVSCSTPTGDEQEHYFLERDTLVNIPYPEAWLPSQPS